LDFDPINSIDLGGRVSSKDGGCSGAPLETRARRKPHLLQLRKRTHERHHQSWTRSPACPRRSWAKTWPRSN